MKQRKYRLIVLIAAGCILLVLVAGMSIRIYGGMRLSKAVTRYSKEVGPLDLNQYAPAAVAIPAENSATWVLAGANAIILNKKDAATIGSVSALPVEKWDSKSKAEILEILNRNEPGLQLLERSLQFQNSSYDLTYDKGVEMELPPLLKIFSASKLLMCKARLELQRSEVEPALNSLVTSARIAATLGHEATLITSLFSLAIEKFLFELIHEMLPKLNAQSISLLSAHLRNIQSVSTSPKSIYAAEGAAMYQAVLYHPKVFFEGNYYEELPSFQMWLYPFCKPLYGAMLLEFYEHAVREFENPAAHFSRRSDSDGMLASMFNPEAFLGPNLHSVTERFQTTASGGRLAQTALDLRSKALKEGKYLTDLSTYGDITSPYTGEKVVYRLEPDGSAILTFPETERLVRKTLLEPKVRLTWKLPPVSVSH